MLRNCNNFKGQFWRFWGWVSGRQVLSDLPPPTPLSILEWKVRDTLNGTVQNQVRLSDTTWGGELALVAIGYVLMEVGPRRSGRTKAFPNGLRHPAIVVVMPAGETDSHALSDFIILGTRNRV